MGREATPRPADTYLVSYPRSGNTWLSFILTNLLYPASPTTFENLEDRCPDIYVHTERALRSTPTPGLRKSHEPFDARYAKVIYLVRDPRDVAMSYQRYLRKVRAIPDELPPDVFLQKFLAGTWDTYGTWGSHVGSWLGAGLDESRLLLIRYEDLHSRPRDVVTSLAAFLGTGASASEIDRAVTLSDAESMRRLEQEQATTHTYLKKTRLDILFVGQAQVGRGSSTMSDEARARLEAAWGPLMGQLGYL